MLTVLSLLLDFFYQYCNTWIDWLNVQPAVFHYGPRSRLGDALSSHAGFSSGNIHQYSVINCNRRSIMKTTAGPNLVVSLAPYFNVHVTNFVIFSIWRGTFQVICSTSMFLSYISLNFLETKLYDLVILRFMYVIYPSVMSVGYSTSTWLPTTTLDFSLFYNHPFL